MMNKNKEVGIISAIFTMLMELIIGALCFIIIFPLMLVFIAGFFIFLICIPPVIAIVVVSVFIGMLIFSILPEKWKIKLYNKYKGKF